MDREVGKLVGIIFLIVVLVVVAGIIVFLSIQHPERRLDVGANIESIEIKDNLADIVLSGGANDKEIERIKFIFTDSNGVKHYYSTTEGIENLSQPYKKSIANLFKKPEFQGSYKYIIDSNELGFNNFDSIYKIEVVFDYKKEGLDVDKEVPLDEEIINEDRKPSGGGGGGGGDSIIPDSLLPSAYWRYSGSEVILLNDMPYGTSLKLVLENSGISSGTVAEFTIYERDWLGDDYMAKLSTNVGSNGYAYVDWIINETHVDAARNLLEGNKLELYFEVRGIKSDILKISFTDTGAEANCSDNIQNQDETDVDCGGLICGACGVVANCSDNIQNQNETGVDCGGECAACPPPENLIHWWKFDNDATDSAGTADGIRSGTTFTTGKIDQALSFDGLDDYVNITHDSSFELGEGTIMMWFNMNDLGDNTLFSKDLMGCTDDCGHISMGYNMAWLTGCTDRFCLRLQNDGNGAHYMLLNNEPELSIVENTWYHVALTFGTNGMYLYINGVEHDYDGSVKGMDGNQQDLLIGRLYPGGATTDSFNGLIDDVRIYNISLTEAEILDLYNSGEITPPQHECYTSSDCSVITCKQATCQIGAINTCQYSNIPDCGSGFKAREFFHDQNFLIPENVVLNDYVGEKIISPNHEPSGTVTFEVTGGTGYGKFSINSNTGIITVSDTSGINNGPSSYTLQLRATDTVYEDYATVTIDVLDVDSGNVVFIDPSYSGIETGNRSQPYNSWRDFSWSPGVAYLQRRGTTFTTSETFYIGSGVTMGAYGQGQRPIMSFVIPPTPNTYAFHTSTNDNIVVRDIDFRAINSVAVFYTDANGLVVDNCIFSGDTYNTFRGGHSGSMSDVKILNSELSGPQDDGIWMMSTTDLEVAYTTIYDVNKRYLTHGRDSGGDNIHLSSDFNRNTYIHHNKLDHSSTGYKHVFIIMGDGQPQNLILEHNLILGSGDTFSTALSSESPNGISILNVNGATIRYNVIRDTDRGLHCYAYSCHNVLFAYNTIYRNYGAAVQIMNGCSNIELYNNVIAYYGLQGATDFDHAINAASSPMKLRNNIIYTDNGRPIFFTDGGRAANIDEDYNIFYPDSSIALGSNSQNTNPLFVDVANGDFRLQSNSPAIGVGVDVGLTQDLDQNPIVGSPDIGAYEYQDAVATNDDFDIIFSQNFDHHNAPVAYTYELKHPDWNNITWFDSENRWTSGWQTASQEYIVIDDLTRSNVVKYPFVAEIIDGYDSQGPGRAGESIYMPLGGNYHEVYVSYNIQFMTDWDWITSGKIGGGVRSGNYNHGDGCPPPYGAGWTSELIYDWNYGGNPAWYTYYPDMNCPYGDSFSWADHQPSGTNMNYYDNGKFYFDVTEPIWYNVAIRYVVNTFTGSTSNNDALMEGYINGKLIGQVEGLHLLDYPLSSTQINGLFFRVFQGGGTTPRQTQWLYIDDVVVWTYDENADVPRGNELSPPGRVLTLPPEADINKIYYSASS